MRHFRHASTAPLVALLGSLALHAVAGMLFSHWRRLPPESPRPLTVVLAAAAPQAVDHLRPSPERAWSSSATSARAAPVLPSHQEPFPRPVAVERNESAAAILRPAPEGPPAPAVVATAQAEPGLTGRADAGEPPYSGSAYLDNPPPAYPLMARRLGQEGLVILRVQVNSRGTPEHVAVARTSGAPVLDEAALKAVRGWRFVPARRGDIPIAQLVDVPVRFRLEN